MLSPKFNKSETKNVPRQLFSRQMKAVSDEAALTEQQTKAAAADRARQYAENMYFGEKGELEYARGIELTNGR